MPGHVVANHHQEVQSTKPELGDSFLDNNGISSLMSERKNGIIICFLKKTTVELMKTTKKSEGHKQELVGITRAWQIRR